MATKKRIFGPDSFGGKTSLSSPKPVDRSNDLPATRGRRMRASRAEIADAVTGARKVANVNRTKSARAQAAAAALPNKITANSKPRPQTQAQKQAEILAAKRAANARKRPTPRPKRDAAPRSPRPGSRSQAKLPGSL